MTNMTRRHALRLGAASLTAPLFGAPAVQELAAPRQLGIAFLGLGNYATEWLAPAAAQAATAKVAGVITGSPEKIPKWQEKYEFPDANAYSYENLEKIADNPEIDVVYVVTPTGTHADFAIRALEAGKHVICEKPMAPMVADCDRMIAAAKKADRTLQIGYRLYWDPFHVRLLTAVRDQEFGPWNKLETAFGSNMKDFDKPLNAWRIDKELGVAGALYDVGVYAIQAGFYASGMHPAKVTAKSWTDRPEHFTEVPEHWEWELEYPDGRKSQHMSSYGQGGNYIRSTTPEGELSIEPAYGYDGQKGVTPEGPMNYEQIFQQRQQIDSQCRAILKRDAIITPAEMGRRDIRVANAVMEAAESGKAVEFGNFEY